MTKTPSEFPRQVRLVEQRACQHLKGGTPASAFPRHKFQCQGRETRTKLQGYALVHQLQVLFKAAATVPRIHSSLPSVPSARCPPAGGPSLCQALEPQRKTKQSLLHMTTAGIVSVQSVSQLASLLRVCPRDPCPADRREEIRCTPCWEPLLVSH